MMHDLLVGVNAVVLAVTDGRPKVLTVQPEPTGENDGDGSVDRNLRALPFGPFNPADHRTLELCIREFVRDQTGSELGYVEQLYTFADQGRDPREHAGGGRVMSVAYMALWQESALSGSAAAWEDCYTYFPWEDWRHGRPDLMPALEDALKSWSASASGRTIGERNERVDICFGFGEAGWDAYKVLERYELLYEAGLIAESWFDRGEPAPARLPIHADHPMAFDHRRILATALARIRGKLRYRPLVFELVPASFTLLNLQQVVEAVSGLKYHKQNFRRLVESSGMVEMTGEQQARTGGRPAKLFRFRRAVLSERRAPGVGSLNPPREP
jgi:hypothetical protein